MPNYVRMEMQVLAGILPISRVSAVPACIHFACQYVPLERVLDLTHPDAEELALVEDKRTWRDGTRREVKREPVWKAMDVLTAYALKKGWVTAKAGRPEYVFFLFFSLHRHPCSDHGTVSIEREMPVSSLVLLNMV